MDSDNDFSMDFASDDDSMFDENENQTLNRVQAIKQESAQKPAVLHSSTNDAKKKKTVEEIYQKKSQLEHILLRPDTYSKLECLVFLSPPWAFHRHFYNLAHLLLLSPHPSRIH